MPSGAEALMQGRAKKGLYRFLREGPGSTAGEGAQVCPALLWGPSCAVLPLDEGQTLWVSGPGGQEK
jgi:hypothetical protein